jgi:hypothetical protein
MKKLEYYLFTRPYSIVVAGAFGLTAAGLGSLWIPLAFVVVGILLGLLMYFNFFYTPL